MSNKGNIKIRSEKANEILGTPPHFIVRSGIGLIALMLLIFLSTSLIIEYPDFIRTKITISGGRSPVTIVAEKSEVIENILIKEGDMIQEGQALAVLKNEISYRNIKLLKAFSDSIKTSINTGKLEMNFINPVNDYKIKKGKLKSAADRLINLTNEYNSLFGKGYETKQALKTGQKKGHSNANLIQSIQQAIHQVDEELKNWEQDYVIKAGISGKVSFYKLWSEKQQVSKGDELMIIIPESSEIFGYASIPVASSGKLKEGQEVNIKLDQYPYETFGMIKGIVHSVSNFAKDEQYIIRINLPEGLTTSYGRRLNFLPDMKGEAQIITENLTVFNRIFNKMKKKLYR